MIRIAMVVLGCVLLAGCSGAGEEEATPTPSATTAASGTTPAETRSTTATPTAEADGVRLTVPATATGRCAAPTAERLSQAATLAFEGTATSVVDGRATLEVSHWYLGDGPSTVEVSAPGEDLQALIAAVDLKPGERYLLAADADDRLLVCGNSTAWSRQAEALYADAFGSTPR